MTQRLLDFNGLPLQAADLPYLSYSWHHLMPEVADRPAATHEDVARQEVCAHPTISLVTPCVFDWTEPGSRQGVGLPGSMCNTISVSG